MDRAEIESKNPCNFCDKSAEERLKEHEPCEKWYEWENEWRKVVWKNDC